jgi:hypothetical protein
MRKLIAILFILILPLQLTATASAAYCQHEQDSQAKQQLGHHAHEHKANQSADAGDSGDNPVKVGYDADCPSCHAFGIQAVVSPMHTMFSATGGQAIPHDRAYVPDALPDAPFRPPLAHLA